MPYIYSLGYQTHEHRRTRSCAACFWTSPTTPTSPTSRDEYMFGPALLVAPVTEQGSTSRKVYLPAGTDWYNFWTNERVHGGQTITVAAPIDTIPLFVRAGSILPLGAAGRKHQREASHRQGPRLSRRGRATSLLYQDDGTTYDYEQGKSEITQLHWNDAAAKLTATGAKAWTKPDSEIIEVVGK